MSRFLRGDEKRAVNLLERGDGSVTDPGRDTILELVRAHFPNATEEKVVSYSSENNMPLGDIKAAFGEWIGLEKITLALKGFDKKKSPGLTDSNR